MKNTTRSVTHSYSLMEEQQDEDDEQLEEDQRRGSQRPFPVKYPAAITKLMTNVADEAAALRETLGKDGSTDEDAEERDEYFKKFEVLIKQCLHELEEERQQPPPPPHDDDRSRSVTLGNGSASTSAATTTTTANGHSGTSTNGHSNQGDHSGSASTSATTTTTAANDHSGTSTNGHSNQGDHSGSGFFPKEIEVDNNEIQVIEEEDHEDGVDVVPSSKLEAVKDAFVCFPSNALLPKRSYGVIGLPEGLMFLSMVHDLYTIREDAKKSISGFEEEVEYGLNQIERGIIRFQNILRNDDQAEGVVVIEWLKDVTDAVIKTIRVINDLIAKTGCSGSRGRRKKMTRAGKLCEHPLTPSFVNDSYSKATQEATKQLKDVCYMLEEMLDRHRRRRRRSWPHQEIRAPTNSRADDVDLGGGGHDDIVGREKDIEMIRKHLMSEEKRVQVISVVGMFGSGKTALAHQIYSQYSDVCSFDVFAWAQSEGGGGEGAGAGCSQQRIRFLTDTWSEILDTALREKVIDQMHQMKRKMDVQIITTGGKIAWNQHGDLVDLLRNHRYLIIIDDITTTEAWDEVRKALPMDTMNGSRILLTTRDTSVALHAIHHQPGSPPPHQLGPLSVDKSWELFTLKVRNPNPIPSDLESVGKQIVEKCYGLPFAIEHLADHLLTQETSNKVWSNVLESAEQQDNYHTPWSYVLNMIVEDLSLNLKWCLSYFGLFPKNYAIPVRRLIALWVAEGFVDQIEGKTLENIAEEYLQKLIDLNIVQVTKQKSNGRPQKCCLTNYLREHLSTRGKQANWVRLAYHPEVNPPALPASPDFDFYSLLLSFLSFDYREGYEPGEQIRKFIYGGLNKGHFELLRVIDLEGVYKPGLPKEMGKLINLRYLGLRWTYLDSFPSFIGNLINLETLDIKHTYISTLPASIWKLQKLRHVYLNECYLDNFVPQPGADYMENLQTLCGVHVDKESCVLEGFKRFTKITRPGVSSEPKQKGMAGGSPGGADYMENLQTLWGVHVDEESSVLEGFKRYTKITRLEVSCNLTSEPKQKGMADWISNMKRLQSLWFRSKDRLGKLGDVHLNSFTNHEHLNDLYFHGQLKLFEVGEFPPNLTELTLSASKLQEDPMPTLEKLPHLRILRLYCDSYLGEHMDCSPTGFKALQELKIWKLKNLKTWTVNEKTMPMLKKLEIRSCHKLESLPVELQQITTLEELQLIWMPINFTEEVKKDEYKDWYKKANVRFSLKVVN